MQQMKTEAQSSKKKKKVFEVFGLLSPSAILQVAEKYVFNCLTLVQKLRLRGHADTEAQAGSTLSHPYKAGIPSNETVKSTE